MAARCLILAALLLAGCESPAPFRGTGEAALGPLGWYDYCARHPADPDC